MGRTAGGKRSYVIRTGFIVPLTRTLCGRRAFGTASPLSGKSSPRRRFPVASSQAAAESRQGLPTIAISSSDSSMPPQRGRSTPLRLSNVNERRKEAYARIMPASTCTCDIGLLQEARRACSACTTGATALRKSANPAPMSAKDCSSDASLTIFLAVAGPILGILLKSECAMQQYKRSAGCHSSPISTSQSSGSSSASSPSASDTHPSTSMRSPGGRRAASSMGRCKSSSITICVSYSLFSPKKTTGQNRPRRSESSVWIPSKSPSWHMRAIW
mmetsp:Transcript_21950/g.59169  ORF Transcript_21950/g.59169 Transcript_21950/m.59169 type:complete len:273 (+) Transcript_21950:1835-2653(+)